MSTSWDHLHLSAPDADLDKLGDRAALHRRGVYGSGVDHRPDVRGVECRHSGVTRRPRVDHLPEKNRLFWDVKGHFGTEHIGVPQKEKLKEARAHDRHGTYKKHAAPLTLCDTTMGHRARGDHDHPHARWVLGGP